MEKDSIHEFIIEYFNSVFGKYGRPTFRNIKHPRFSKEYALIARV